MPNPLWPSTFPQSLAQRQLGEVACRLPRWDIGGLETEGSSVSIGGYRGELKHVPGTLFTGWCRILVDRFRRSEKEGNTKLLRCRLRLHSEGVPTAVLTLCTRERTSFLAWSLSFSETSQHQHQRQQQLPLHRRTHRGNTSSSSRSSNDTQREPLKEVDNKAR